MLIYWSFDTIFVFITQFFPIFAIDKMINIMTKAERDRVFCRTTYLNTTKLGSFLGSDKLFTKKFAKNIVNMKTNKITAKDIRELGAYGTLTALLPSYRHCRTVCNVVNYVRKSYPRADGLGYWTRINGTTITIGVGDVERINRWMTIDEIKALTPKL